MLNNCKYNKTYKLQEFEVPDAYVKFRNQTSSIADSNTYDDTFIQSLSSITVQTPATPCPPAFINWGSDSDSSLSTESGVSYRAKTIVKRSSLREKVKFSDDQSPVSALTEHDDRSQKKQAN